MAGPAITAKFIADTSQMTSEVDKATSSAGGRVKDFAANAAVAIGGAFAVTKIVDFGKQAIDAASNLQESMSKIGVVFGTSGDAIVKWSQDSAAAMGISQQQALAAAGTYGNLAVSMGLPQDQAANMSTSLVQLAADMASFNNVPVDDALNALQSGLVGETEPLKKFGVNLNEAALKAEALAMGLADGKAPLTAAAKAQASYSLIMKQSSTAQGDFARTSEGVANQQKIAAAETENMKAAMGDALLPVMEDVTGALNVLIPIFERFAPIIVPLAAAFGIYSAAISVATTVQTAFGVSLGISVGWIALIAVGVAALVAGVIWAWNNVDWFRSAVEGAFKAISAAFGWIMDAAKAVWKWVSDNWPLLLAIITGPIGMAVAVVVRNWDTIKAAASTAWDFIKSLAGTLFDALTWPYRQAWSVISSVWDNIKGGATATFDFVKGVFSGLANAITAPIKIAWNALASVWNSTVGAVAIKIPGWVPGPLGGQGFDVPDLPRLAKGGVLTSPTLFLGGEAGREIVTPEDLMRSIIREEGGGRYELNIYPRTADASDIAYGFRRLELLAGVT